MTVFTLKVSILCKLILTVGHKPTYIVSNTYVECSNWNWNNVFDQANCEWYQQNKYYAKFTYRIDTSDEFHNLLNQNQIKSTIFKTRFDSYIWCVCLAWRAVILSRDWEHLKDIQNLFFEKIAFHLYESLRIVVENTNFHSFSSLISYKWNQILRTRMKYQSSWSWWRLISMCWWWHTCTQHNVKCQRENHSQTFILSANLATIFVTVHWIHCAKMRLEGRSLLNDSLELHPLGCLAIIRLASISRCGSLLRRNQYFKTKRIFVLHLWAGW